MVPVHILLFERDSQPLTSHLGEADAAAAERHVHGCRADVHVFPVCSYLDIIVILFLQNRILVSFQELSHQCFSEKTEPELEF